MREQHNKTVICVSGNDGDQVLVMTDIACGKSVAKRFRGYQGALAMMRLAKNLTAGAIELMKSDKPDER